MPQKKTPAEFSAYLITHSDEPSMPVDAVLIDKGKLLERDWNVMNFASGETTSACGVRLLRLCPDCRTQHKAVGSLGHEGECGSEAVREEACQEIAHAKKQVKS